MSSGNMMRGSVEMWAGPVGATEDIGLYPQCGGESPNLVTFVRAHSGCHVESDGWAGGQEWKWEKG